MYDYDPRLHKHVFPEPEKFSVSVPSQSHENNCRIAWEACRHAHWLRKTVPGQGSGSSGWPQSSWWHPLPGESER